MPQSSTLATTPQELLTPDIETHTHTHTHTHTFMFSGFLWQFLVKARSYRATNLARTHRGPTFSVLPKFCMRYCKSKQWLFDTQDYLVVSYCGLINPMGESANSCAVRSFNYLHQGCVITFSFAIIWFHMFFDYFQMDLFDP